MIDSLSQLLWVLVSAALVNNLVVIQFLGLCPFFGVSTNLDRGIGMSLATSLVLVLSTSLSYLLQHYLLEPFHLALLGPLVFILAVAFSVQLAEIIVRFANQRFYQLVGVFFPLITVNCAILGSALWALTKQDSLIAAATYGLGGGLGFSLLLLLLSAARERLDSIAPKLVQGAPLALITMGIVSMAFGGFSGVGA